jgi:transposase
VAALIQQALAKALREKRAMTEKMLRGSKIRIFPTKRQTRLLDLWRKRTISLWNLLLSLEQAAYGGENTRSKLGWRSIWARVLEENHAKTYAAWENGKTIRVGKNKGKVIPPCDGPAPEPVNPEVLAKINRSSSEMNPETGERLPAKLFMWDTELLAIMARLKQVPRTEWIADLPSHAAQRVVKDLISALQAMLRERRKRASGAGGRDTGFPKFKKNRYGAGSVYFANTQLEFDFENQRVRFPNGCGWMRCELPRHLRSQALEDRSKIKLMGGRVWRQGERTYLSCQWEVERPAALKPTGRTAGVKIGAKVLLTTYDDRGQTREYTMPEPDKKLETLHRVAAKRLSRSIEAQKKREKRIKANGYSQRREKRLVATGKKDRPLRLRRTPGFYASAARLAGYEAIERDRRDGFLHELTTSLVRRFDAIAVQRFEVARLMEKESTKKKRRLARIDNAVERNATAEDIKKQRPMKPVRKLMRRVAMARCGQLLEYKFKDLRGPDAFQKIDPHDVNATACSGCGSIHPKWKEASGIMRCHEVLASGEICGTALPRNRNAARLTKRELDVRRKAKIKEAV